MPRRPEWCSYFRTIRRSSTLRPSGSSDSITNLLSGSLPGEPPVTEPRFLSDFLDPELERLEPGRGWIEPDVRLERAEVDEVPAEQERRDSILDRLRDVGGRPSDRRSHPSQLVLDIARKGGDVFIDIRGRCWDRFMVVFPRGLTRVRSAFVGTPARSWRCVKQRLTPPRATKAANTTANSGTVTERAV